MSGWRNSVLEHVPQKWVPVALTARAALLSGALALGACSTTLNLGGSTSSPAVDGGAQAASPANIASLTEVVQRNPNDAQAYNMRGTVLGRAGRNAEALSDFDHAIAIDANYAQAYANRGQVHPQMATLDSALADSNKAPTLD